MAELTRGKFIVLEGIDGSGKTTQLEALAAWLPTSGLMPSDAQLITTKAPGGTVLGKCLRELLLHASDDTEPCPITELLLYVADTAQLVAQVIEPALASGDWVLCDRFTGSTVAYQGAGRGHDPAVIMRLNQLATSGLVPDLTFWLDLPLAVSPRRLTHRPADRIEAGGDVFLGRVAEGYLDQYILLGADWYWVDANQPVENVTSACHQLLRTLL
jgi:dTMP kinase